MPSEKKYLGIHFVSCKAYGRLYQNKGKTAYIGQCPKCGKPVKVRIGAEGTPKRFFQAFCR